MPKFRWRRCPVCGKQHYGWKPVGSLDVFDLRGRKIATATRLPQPGYAHLECKRLASWLGPKG